MLRRCFHRCLVASLLCATASCFQTTLSPNSRRLHSVEAKSGDIDLKTELTDYLNKRKKVGADEAALAEVGKVVGRKKGDVLLDYVGLSPKKEVVVEEAPEVFDYGELIKYGFSHLVTPIMEAGGRTAMYDLMGMERPEVKPIAKPKTATKIVIDRTGENDRARYSGLKMGQVLDDDLMGDKLAEAIKKSKEGKELRPKLIEEEFQLPFADKRNVGPQQTPDWTPEKLDESMKDRGKVYDWARQVRAGDIILDEFETPNIEGSLRLYSVFSSIVIALGFGRSTSGLLLNLLDFDDKAATSIIDAIQGPALALVLTSVGSSIASFIVAAEKNRSKFVWGFKGLLGGPPAILELRALESTTNQSPRDQDE